MSIQHKQFRFISWLGKGTFATVFKAQDLNSNDVIALKRICCDREGAHDSAKREQHAYSRLHRHRNVLRLLSHSVQEGAIVLCLELCMTDLHCFLAVHGSQLSFEEMRCCTRQLMQALRYIHSEGIMHRDIHPANILIHADGLLKVADFGLSCVINAPLDIILPVMALQYRAPELLRATPCYYDESVDIWSAGCTIAEIMLRGVRLFPSLDEVDQLKQIRALCGTPSPSAQEGDVLASLFDSRSVPTGTTEYICALLRLKPSARLTATDACSSDFVHCEPPRLSINL